MNFKYILVIVLALFSCSLFSTPLSPGGILFQHLDFSHGASKYWDKRHLRCAKKYAEKAIDAEKDYYNAEKALEERPGGVRKIMLEMKMNSAKKKYTKYKNKSNNCTKKAKKAAQPKSIKSGGSI
ncbi:MAG: hypothetical protein JAY74_09145 [Candidatus Thiodiazotropha taylori]|nr:hypothetical protein [Candidatus Thiodiazotropha taylori]